MPIIVKWYDEDQQNIQYEVIGNWSWEDLYTAIDEAVQLLDSVDYPVHLILDMTQTSFVPKFAIPQLSKVANAATMSHPNTKNLLVVGANSYIKVMLKVFKRLFSEAGKRYHVFHSVEALNEYLIKDAKN